MTYQFLTKLLLLGAIWGASFPFMLVAVAEFKPLALIEVRVAIGAILLTGILAARGELASLRGRSKQFLVLGAINTAIPFSLFAFAAQFLTAGMSSVLNSTAPLFAALVAFVCFRERLRAQQSIGLILGFCGILILASSKNSIGGNPLAILGGLTAAMLYGVAAHYSKRNLQGCPPLAVAAGSLIAATLFLLPTLPFSLSAESISVRAWSCAAALGILCTGIAYLLYFHMISTYGAARSMTVAYLIPVFGIIWGALFLGEAITPTMLVGGSVVLAGTILVTRATQKTHSTTQEVRQATDRDLTQLQSASSEHPSAGIPRLLAIPDDRAKEE